jgi:hypothetical protein
MNIPQLDVSSPSRNTQFVVGCEISYQQKQFVTLFKVLASTVKFGDDAIKFVRLTKCNNAQLFYLITFAAL